MQIAENTVVAFHYTLTNEAGQTIDSSRQREEPLNYLHGHGNIIPGLEKALVGKQAGDKLEGAGGELKPGMQFQAQTEAGQRIFTITEVEGDQVTVDGNHPLAGETLNFDVEVTEVREASDEEKEHGHVHGPEGHEH